MTEKSGFPTKPVLQPGKLMRTYPAVHACGTTLTPRFEVTCECPTYSSNAGVCKTFEAGLNGRCVYCDHTRLCHSEFMLSSSPLKTPSQIDRDSRQRERAIELCRGLAIPENEQVIKVIIYALDLWMDWEVAHASPLRQEFTLFTLWLVEYEKSTGLILDSRSAFIGWQAALAATKEQP